MKSRDPIAAVPPPASSNKVLLAQTAHWLTRCAARRSPAALAERLEEEWLADLALRRGTLPQLRFALGCCWAARVIAHDPIAFGATAAAAAGGSGVGASFAAHDPSFFSRRTTVLILILCLHAAAIYGFASGFVRQVFTEALPHSFKGVVLDPTVVDIQPLKPQRIVPTAGIVAALPHVPDFGLPQLVPSVNEESVPGPPLTIEAAAPARDVSRVLGGPGAGFPATRDFYPPGSIRAEESGAAAVRVCVDGNGRLTSDPLIVESSGYRRLDGGALALARAGSGHYRSTTENGAPVSGCYAFRVRFELQSLR
jgi:TonB family protein